MNIKRFINQYGFRDDDMVILTDDQQRPAGQPTKANIMRAMQWLVSDGRPHDSLFFHYSGHGGQSVDWNSDQDDVYDETIYPVDFNRAGQIANTV
jgi:metacaspase-1